MSQHFLRLLWTHDIKLRMSVYVAEQTSVRMKKCNKSNNYISVYKN